MKREVLSPALILAAATVACLLPFAGKAFHIDDPLFVWTARHIQTDPLNFYGFNVNWYVKSESIARITQNPPLASYYLAAIGSVFGWSEAALHIGMLVPAVACILGVWRLARLFCAHPMMPALATLAAPGFILCASSVMCDTMMVALWVWAVYFWVVGLKEKREGLLWAAAGLMTLCSLTKYFGASLAPLLLAYSLIAERRAGRWLLCLALPLAALGGYEWLTRRMYGAGLFSNAIGFVGMMWVKRVLAFKLLAGLAFTGGCAAAPLAALPWLWGRKGLIVGIAAAVVVALYGAHLKRLGFYDVVENGQTKWGYLAQLGIWAAGGLTVIALAVCEAWRKWDPATALLVLWMAGTLGFAVQVNWTVSGRNMLPMIPAVMILLTRHLEGAAAAGRPDALRWRWLPVALSLAVALLAGQGDWLLAQSAKRAASLLTQQLKPVFSDIQFEGHWGFQYYMEELGARALDRNDLRLGTNTAVVVSLNNGSIMELPADQVAYVNVFSLPASQWVATMDRADGAGYYSHVWGVEPFVFCEAAPQFYVVYRGLGRSGP